VPDGGMWDMSQLVLEELKRCCGYKGEWACEKDYPDHMLPFSEFGIYRDSPTGLHHMCKSCMSMRDVPHHAISNIIDNAVSKIAYKVAGSSKSFYKLPKEERISIRKDAKRSYLLDHRPAEEVLAFMGHTKHNAQKLTERNLLAEKLYGRKEWNTMMKARESNIAPFVYPQEHEKRLKSAGRSVESAIKARNANKDDGFTYTLTHPLWPEIKIGYTYNPPSRLSQFNTCCPHRLFSMPYISTYLKDAKLAEEAIHETLKEYRADGEWFNVSLEIATKTIEDYVRSLDDNPQEQALG